MEHFGLLNVWTTEQQGASEAFSIGLAEAGPIYAWPVIDDDSDAAYSYALDGTVIGTLNVRTDPAINTRNGTKRSLGFLRIPNVPAGTHVLKFTQTSSGDRGLSIAGVGAPVVEIGNSLPVVLIGTIPHQMHTGAPEDCFSSDASCLQYTQDIKEDLNLLLSDGLDVRLFDTRKYMFATPSEMIDGLHPNALGQRELAKSVEAVWPST